MGFTLRISDRSRDYKNIGRQNIGKHSVHKYRKKYRKNIGRHSVNRSCKNIVEDDFM